MSYLANQRFWLNDKSKMIKDHWSRIEQITVLLQRNKVNHSTINDILKDDKINSLRVDESLKYDFEIKIKVILWFEIKYLLIVSEATMSE